MHIAEFLQTDDDTLRQTIADMRRRADGMDTGSTKRGVYSPQAALRREAHAMEQLLNCRTAVTNIPGALKVTFTISGSKPDKKMPRSHRLFEHEEV